MRTLRAAEFTALLTRADVSQAAFARLAGITARQVNNRARGRAIVPVWAGLIVVVLQEHSPQALTIMLEETAAAGLMTEAIDTPEQIDTPPRRPSRSVPLLKR